MRLICAAGLSERSTSAPAALPTVLPSSVAHCLLSLSLRLCPPTPAHASGPIRCTPLPPPLPPPRHPTACRPVLQRLPGFAHTLTTRASSRTPVCSPSPPAQRPLWCRMPRSASRGPLSPGIGLLSPVNGALPLLGALAACYPAVVPATAAASSAHAARLATGLAPTPSILADV